MTNETFEVDEVFSNSSSSFDLLRVRIASPQSIKLRSSGSVKKAETINYRTLAPEKEGLFCQRIFGPIKDWECACGKYKRIRYRGIVCEVCGVEVTESRVRRYQTGHIELACPISHIWFLKGIPSYLSLLLDITLKDLEQVTYFNAYIVIEPGESGNLKKKQLLSEDEYDELVLQGAEFRAGMGAEAILELINDLTKTEYEFPDKPRTEQGKVLSMPGLEEVLLETKAKIKETKSTSQKRAKLVKRLRLVSQLLLSKTDPGWVIMDVLPVLPPDLRPMVQLDGGRFATSDLNDLYRRVINRNNRLLKLKEMYAPEIIIRNEKRMLQEAVDALIDNGRRGREVVGTNGRRLKSLSDIIEGKQGRFRQNLLGKRVDYSGRSVIVVGPNLKLNQCGVPAPILLELFKPFIVEKLIKKGLAANIKTAKRMIEHGKSIVWDILGRVIKDHPVLLNRAPTLHRLGIQAFEPILVEGRAIQLHPLVCASFNADFDGDQMAIHVPLSVEAQAEAKTLILASNNILLPSTGEPSISPTQDMVLGLFYLTIDHKDSDNPEICKGAGKFFLNTSDVILAYESGLVSLHATVNLRISKGQFIKTTAGKAIINNELDEILAGQKKLDQDQEDLGFINYKLNKKALGHLILSVYNIYGTSVTAEVANALKNIGFQYATRASITIGIEDLDVPEIKKDLIKEASAQIEEAKRLFQRGDITEVERYNRVIDTWSETTEKVTEAVIDNFDHMNSVYMMAFSGARGNISQVRQLVGMRGLMSDSQGEIIDTPIKTNFKEGLTVTEYVISSYGARKGIVDTALKTADSGYLTRRLVDVAQDVIIQEEDCGTEEGILLSAITERGRDVLSLEKRLFSRTTAEDIFDPETKELICPRNTIIGKDLAKRICGANIEEVKVRSPLTCQSERGVCQSCYGYSLATGKKVSLGEAVGIIAAQSIGEPGTQLTMRTFHTGGAVSAGLGSRKSIKALQAGIVTYDQGSTFQTRTRYGEIVQEVSKELVIEVGNQSYEVPVGALIKLQPGAKVKENQLIAEYSESTVKILTEQASKDIISINSGQVTFKNFEMEEKEDRYGNISRSSTNSGTIWVMEGHVYNLPAHSEIVIEDGQSLSKGSILGESSLHCEHEGVVKYSKDLKVIKEKKNEKSYNQLVSGKELNIIVASIKVNNVELIQSPKGDWEWLVNEGEKYTLNYQHGEFISDETIIAEAHFKNIPSVLSSGEIRYSSQLKVDEKRNLLESGEIYFIPEEIHLISKDISLKFVNSGDRVKSGQEIVKDVITRIEGIVELKVENDIISEAVVRPGEIYDLSDLADLKVEEGEIVEKDTEILPGIKVNYEKALVSLVTNEETGEAQVFLRPVQSFLLEEPKIKLQLECSLEEKFSLKPFTTVLYRDGERVKSLEGGQLLRTSLTLQMKDELKELKAHIEKENDQIVLLVQDTVLLRGEGEGSSTRLLVEDGEKVQKNDVIAKIEVKAQSEGEARLSAHDDRKILLITKENLCYLKVSKDQFKSGDYLRKGDQIGENLEEVSQISGRVISVDESGGIIVLKGQPYLISRGAQIQVEPGIFVQRGDQLASLIYEQQKTGDIVQGLPKVEELLEGRKPKDLSCVLAPTEGTFIAETSDSDGSTTYYVESETEKHKLTIPVNQKLLVENNQQVKQGDLITSGSANSHEILEILGIRALRKHLVDEVQSVYCAQGVTISDKHVEVIVKQMTKKIRVEEPGDTDLLPGELIEYYELQKANSNLEEGEEKATFTPLLLGITKASLNTKSFISAASFQETTRILTEAALAGKPDWLKGLKENIVIGRLIPSGTNFRDYQKSSNKQELEESLVSSSEEMEMINRINEDSIV